jgi:hypothetical protein
MLPIDMSLIVVPLAVTLVGFGLGGRRRRCKDQGGADDGGKKLDGGHRSFSFFCGESFMMGAIMKEAV